MDLAAATAAVAERCLALLRALPAPTAWTVNLGANDGVTYDLLWPAVQAGWGGVAVEPLPEQFGRLCGNMPARVACVQATATPADVCALLEARGVPRFLDMIDVDVDGYDLDLTLAALASFQPSLLSIELNEDVPPGIEFCVRYAPDHSWSGGPFFGCSLSMAVRELGARGYRLLAVDWHHAIFFHFRHDVLFGPPPNPTEAWVAGYWEQPGREQVYYWKDWSDQHWGRPLPEVLERLRRQFADREPERFTLQLAAACCS